MLSARRTIVNSLSHGRLNEFGGVYHLAEVRDAIELVFSGLDHVSKIAATLAADVETCERAIADARRLATTYPSFVTVTFLDPWLKCASARLHEFIDFLRGRFTAIIAQDWAGTDLPKRYPLSESGRQLRILVPFSSNGRGAATDVRINVWSGSQQILFLNEEIALGSVSPGKFSVALDVHVVDPCASVTAMLEIEWGEVGTSRRQEALYEVRVLAQSAKIDWEAYTYADPYGTGPAEGDAFVGRKEQVQTLVARMLRRPMSLPTSRARSASARPRLPQPGRIRRGRVIHTTSSPGATFSGARSRMRIRASRFANSESRSKILSLANCPANPRPRGDRTTAPCRI